MDRVVHLIGNISAIWRRRLLVKCDQFFICWSFPGSPHELTFHRNPVKRSFACERGCYPWHGAPFNVPSDGHTYLINIQYNYYWLHERKTWEIVTPRKPLWTDAKACSQYYIIIDWVLNLHCCISFIVEDQDCSLIS